MEQQATAWALTQCFILWIQTALYTEGLFCHCPFILLCKTRKITRMQHAVGRARNKIL